LQTFSPYKNSGVENVQASGNGIGDFMMYWLGVYGLVIVAGVLPFILLYVVSLGIWLSHGAVELAAQTLKNALASGRETKRVVSTL
jgi:hypothetical protein